MRTNENQYEHNKIKCLQGICEKFNEAEQIIKELKCFVAKTNYLQKR